MEADRLTSYMENMYPYQQFGFFQDALNKVPMGQSTFTASSQGGYNPILQGWWNYSTNWNESCCIEI